MWKCPDCGTINSWDADRCECSFVDAPLNVSENHKIIEDRMKEAQHHKKEQAQSTNIVCVKCSTTLRLCFPLTDRIWTCPKCSISFTVEELIKGQYVFKILQKDRESQGYDTESQWFEILRISPNATVEEIKFAYRELIKQYHPDKVASLGSELQELAKLKTRQINNAYAKAIKRFT